MTRPDLGRLAAALTACSALLLTGATRTSQALPSWNDTPAKTAVLAFVDAVTTPGPEFVPQPYRVAVFDGDGTLWAEQPTYVQYAFAIDRGAEMARRDQALAERPAFAAALTDDPARIAALTPEQMQELVAASHAGTTPETYAASVGRWLRAARAPRFDRPYTGLAFQPMLELMDYLRANGFDIYIVCGGDTEFMRIFAERAYGVAPDHLIGWAADPHSQEQAGNLPSYDGAPARQTGLERALGRPPILAAGNADSDLPILHYATRGIGRRMGLLIHHDDAEREYAYDRQSAIGHLDAALGAAPVEAWTVVSMRADWREVFAVTPAIHDHPPPLRLGLLAPAEPRD